MSFDAQLKKGYIPDIPDAPNLSTDCAITNLIHRVPVACRNLLLTSFSYPYRSTYSATHQRNANISLFIERAEIQE